MRTAYIIFYCAVRFSLSNKGWFLISYNSTRSLPLSFDTSWTLEQVEQRNRSIRSYRKRRESVPVYRVNPITTTEQKLWTNFFVGFPLLLRYYCFRGREATQKYLAQYYLLYMNIFIRHCGCMSAFFLHFL